MTEELVQFGTIMLVVMLGFVMAFYALFEKFESYGNTWLSVFKAMLGEVELFDDFPGDRYEAVGTGLLVVYIVVITIMLLNLLIAVLSTSHARVQEHADTEYKATKACLIEHYRRVVDKDILPVPFNMLHLAISWPCKLVCRSFGGKRAYRGAKRAVGCTVFWCVLGSLSVILGVILWVFSVPYAIAVWHKYYSIKDPDASVGFMIRRYLFLCVWCLLGAPSYLLVLWLKEPAVCLIELVSVCGSNNNSSRTSSPNVEKSPAAVVSVAEMLKNAPGGLSTGDLCKYLDDPMSDPEVRPDETTKDATVEHLKLLRDRLEKVTTEHTRHVVEGINANTNVICDTRAMVEEAQTITCDRDREIGRTLEAILSRLDTVEQRMRTINEGNNRRE